MNIFNPHKPLRMKHMSKHVLANIVLSVLVCYLILAVEQLRAGNCSTELTAPLRDTSGQIPHPITEQLTSPQLSQRIDKLLDQEALLRQITHIRPDAIARRRRPQPICVDGKRAKTFLMIFMGHSGSSAIASELRVHPQIYMENAEMVDHQEVFNTTAALKDTREFFERGLAKGRTSGFKIRPIHILTEPDKWRALVNEFNTRVIWQYRQNIFKAAIGEYSNRYLNDTSVVEGLRKNMTKEERCKIGVGCSYKIENMPFMHTVLKNMIKSQQSIIDAVNEITQDNRGCIRELPYEDYLYEREETLADIFTFLGLRHEPTQPLRYKATDDNLCTVVENWQEICDAFYGCTLYQHMMDDPRHNCYCSMISGTSRYCSL